MYYEKCETQNLMSGLSIIAKRICQNFKVDAKVFEARRAAICQNKKQNMRIGAIK
jgi:hypothetical protein